MRIGKPKILNAEVAENSRTVRGEARWTTKLRFHAAVGR